MTEQYAHLAKPQLRDAIRKLEQVNGRPAPARARNAHARVDRVELIANRHRKGRMQSLSKWGEALTAVGVDRLVMHLRAVRKRIEAGKAGRAFALLAPVTHLPPQQVAATAMRVVVDTLSSCNTLHHVAAELAEKLWIETMLIAQAHRSCAPFGVAAADDGIRLLRSAICGTRSSGTHGSAWHRVSFLLS